MELTELKEYSFSEAIYIGTFGITKEDLKNKPREAIITDYPHLEKNVEEALQTLRERERVVLRKFFEEGSSLCKIGNEFNVSRERIRQIINRAFCRLHRSHRRCILDGSQRRAQIEAEADAERKRAVDENWLQAGTEIKRQKERLRARMSTQLSYGIEYLLLTPACEQKLRALGIERIGELLEKFPYDPQTNGLVGLATAEGIEEIDYREIWCALFTAGFLVRVPELPDFKALKKAEQAAMIRGDESKIMEMPIDDLELLVRSYNCLKRSDINSVGELLKRLNLSPSEFLTRDRCELVDTVYNLGLRKLGRKSAEDIINRLFDVLNGDF